MKAKIHPKYYTEATITCACGHVYNVGSTVEKMEIEICSACHPFYTGKKKLVDTAGRVDKFQAKMAKAKEYQAMQEATKKKKTKKATKKDKTNSQSAKKTTDKKKSTNATK